MNKDQAYQDRLRKAKLAGMIKHSSEIPDDELGLGRTHATHPGWYAMFGYWRGPIDTDEHAYDALREWCWEAKHG